MIICVCAVHGREHYHQLSTNEGEPSISCQRASSFSLFVSYRCQQLMNGTVHVQAILRRVYAQKEAQQGKLPWWNGVWHDSCAESGTILVANFFFQMGDT